MAEIRLHLVRVYFITGLYALKSDYFGKILKNWLLDYYPIIGQLKIERVYQSLNFDTPSYKRLSLMT